MSRIAEVMSRSLLGVSPSTSASEASRLAFEHGVDHLLVLEGDDLVGVVSAGDLQRAQPLAAVLDCMAAPRTVSANSSVEEAADLMRRCAVGCLPVVAGGLLLGVVTRERLRRHPIASQLAQVPA